MQPPHLCFVTNQSEYGSAQSLAGPVENLKSTMNLMIRWFVFKVEGDAPGKAVFVFSLSSAQAIVQTCSAPEPPDLFANELAQSALQEVGNILVSSFIVALSQFSGVNLNLRFRTGYRYDWGNDRFYIA